MGKIRRKLGQKENGRSHYYHGHFQEPQGQILNPRLLISLAGIALAVASPQTSGAPDPNDADGDTVANHVDNCPFAWNPDQLDSGGVGSPVPDSIGDVCQCGDVNNDGMTDISDVVIFSRHLAGLAPAMLDPSKCSVEGGSWDCDAGDILAIREQLVGLPAAFDQLCRAAVGPAELPTKIAAAGDSITLGSAASCSCNTNLFCLLCLAAGDQPENSWFDGSSSSVMSVHDYYLLLDPAIGADQSAATAGAEMSSGPDSFSIQADRILAQDPLPDLAFTLLGSNDICNRGCVDPMSCADPLLTDAEWTQAVQTGLDKLVAGLPAGATIFLVGVPRIQDLRAAGLEKQAQSSSVDCESFWLDWDICAIATQASSLNGESISTRLAGIAEHQRRYNEILREQAIAYTTNSNGRNPRGIEVVAEYFGEHSPSVGTTRLEAADINGGDCFHPSLIGQNLIGEIVWLNNPRR